MGRKSAIDKKIAIELFKKGLTLRAIAEELNSTEDAVRMFIKRNAPKELKKRKEARNNRKKVNSISKDDEIDLEKSNLLSLDDKKKILEQHSHGFGKIHTMGKYSFVLWNRQSYITNEEGEICFDESRGLRTYNVPKKY